MRTGQWEILQEEEQLDEISRRSFEKPQLLFKHSVRCGISHEVYERLGERLDDLRQHADLHFLDLLRHRSLSNRIAEDWGVPHQSPQVILLRSGKPVYAASHFAIDPEGIISQSQAQR
jgi:bacillithiol system protein YtxJ